MAKPRKPTSLLKLPAKVIKSHQKSLMDQAGDDLAGPVPLG
jgi:hypothetical protein